MVAAARKLPDLPRTFGGPHNDLWQHLKSEETLSPDTAALLECTGSTVRTYENQRTNEMVSMFLIVGPTGPTSAHTPEVCFASQNYVRRDARQRITIPGAQQEQDDQFWALSFKTKEVREDLLRVYYGWTAGQRWSAPEDTRFGFVGAPYLYKLQLSSKMPAGTDLKTSDACREFLKDFLPVVRPCLIEPAREWNSTQRFELKAWNYAPRTLLREKGGFPCRPLARRSTGEMIVTTP